MTGSICRIGRNPWQKESGQETLSNRMSLERKLSRRQPGGERQELTDQGARGASSRCPGHPFPPLTASQGTGTGQIHSYEDFCLASPYPDPPKVTWEAGWEGKCFCPSCAHFTECEAAQVAQMVRGQRVTRSRQGHL